MGIKLYKDGISVVFDNRGDSYEIPNYCICLPSRYELKDDYKKKKKTEELFFKVNKFYLP